MNQNMMKNTFESQFPWLNYDNLKGQNGEYYIKDACVRYRYHSRFHFNPFFWLNRVYVWDIHKQKWWVHYMDDEMYNGMFRHDD
jgi:hypothetical protein